MSMPLGLSIASHSGLPPAKVGALAWRGRARRLQRCVRCRRARRRAGAVSPGGCRDAACPVGTAIANAALRPAGAGRQDRRAARPGEQRPIHPRPGRRQLGHERAVRDRAVRPTGDDRGIHGRCAGRPRREPDGVSTARCSAPAWFPSTAPRYAPELPIYLAALGPRMLELAGRIADGVILNLMTPPQAGAAVGVVRASAKAAGRDPESVEIACVVHCCLGSDAPAAAGRRAPPSCAMSCIPRRRAVRRAGRRPQPAGRAGAGRGGRPGRCGRCGAAAGSRRIRGPWRRG